MNETSTMTQTAPSYKSDLYAWARDQATRLRGAKPEAVDWENIAKVVEDLAQAERTAVETDTTLILTQLLKLQYWRSHASLGWRTSTTDSRRRIAEVARRSPSLMQNPEAILAIRYPVAREKAGEDAGRGTTTLPPTCPYTVEQVLNQEFWPEPEEE